VSQVIAGIAWVIANKPFYNIRVMNLSLGHPVGESYRTDPLCRATEVASAAGIVVVVAAGNGGRLNAVPTDGDPNEGYGVASGSITSPGNDPYVITVGAMKQVDSTRADDRIATYSSRGPSRIDYIVKPDIVAPGNQVVSVLAQGGFLDTTYGSVGRVPLPEYVVGATSGLSNYYFRMSGTSMAAPVVAGAAALMLQQQPGLSPATVKARLMMTADKWKTPDGNWNVFAFGAGYLDIPGALSSSVVAGLYAKSPSVTRLPNGQIQLNRGDSWINGSLFGTGDPNSRATWGEAFAGDPTDRATWGEDFVSSPNDRATWGESFWSDTAIYGTYSTCADLSVTALKGDKK